MKTILKIAWLELKTLFSSPIAWLLLIIFTVQIGLDFIGLLKMAIVNQGEERRQFGILMRTFVTERIYGISYLSDSGFLVGVIRRWYLYIPLLTMGLISRELSSGNIKLLFSSPIKVREIVWGKFIGIMCYWALLIGVLLILAICGYLFITDLDLPFIFSCLLGVFLSAMLYSAIGLFVSCLTTYQIVAAIGTFLVLGALDYFGGLWPGVPFLRDVTYFINTGAHTRNFMKGLLISRDIVYFLMLTWMFILFSILTLQDMVHFRSAVVKAGRYILLFLVTLMIGYMASRPRLTWYYDVTAFKTNTLTPASQLVLARIKGPVKITIFDNLFANYKDIAKPEHVNDNISIWEPYKRFLPELEIDYVHFYDAFADGSYPGYPEVSIDSAAKKAAKEQGLDLGKFMPPDSIHKLIDLKAYNNSTIMRISNGGKQVFMRRLTDLNREEYVIANFKRMLDGADTIAFLSENGERSIENEGDDNYKYVMFDHTSTFSLNENGFEAYSHSPEIPVKKQTSILVIADPSTTYSDPAIKNIEDYISAGGNVLIAKGNNDAAILERLTIPLGVRFMPGRLVQPNDKQSANHIKVNLVRSALQDTTYFQSEWNTIQMTDATALSYEQTESFKINPVLLTDEKSTWNKRLESTLDTGQLDFHPEQGDDHRSFPVAVALTRKVSNKEQRIMIIGNAELLTRLGDFYFRPTVLRWFTNGKFPLSMLRKDAVENRVKLSYKESDILKYVLILFIPGLLILFGMIYILKRRGL